MPASKRLIRAAVLAAALSFVACKDSTAPGAFNAANLDTQLQSLSSIIDGNAAFQSLLTLSPFFPTLGAPPMFGATLPAVAVTALRARPPRIAGMARIAIPRSPTGATALFPVNVLGHTIVWDTLLGSYRVDTTISGAPSTGVRIILYTVNTLTGAPRLPLQTLGYVDLKDQSTAQADILGVTLKLGATTVADYTISHVTATNSQGIVIAGYITASDGTGQVTFNHSLQLAGASLTWVSTLGNSSTTLQMQIQGDTLGNGNEVLTLTHSGNTLEFDGTATSGGGFNGQVQYNGAQIATFTLTAGTLVFTGANGHNLRSSDQTHLTAIIAGLEIVVLEMFTGLLVPFLVVATLSLPV